MWSGKTEGKVYNFPNQRIFKTCQSAQKIMSRPRKHNAMFFSWCVGAAGLFHSRMQSHCWSMKPVLGIKKVYGREKSK